MIDRLKVGPVTYTVELISDLHTVEDGSIKRFLAGSMNEAMGKIQLNADYCPDTQIASLWHEALHGILNHAGIEEQPEPIVDALCYGLVALVWDNPLGECVRQLAAVTPRPAPGRPPWPPRSHPPAPRGRVTAARRGS